ncbi:MAG: hypothetical protein J2P28_08335 [Actinobacteria bacterium]|nr:hypothetical protein [Actinomycetota bacterium]MBO0835513.1 hypothetical protein [Actinomycetota bacterium]
MTDAAYLSSTIDTYAAAVSCLEGHADLDAVVRVAAAWAMLTRADAELADRTARYFDS